jgi:hypothetical protein
MSSRFRFSGFTFETSDAGGCAATVTLERPPGKTFKGAATEGPTGSRLRCAATATLAALETAVARAVAFELLGIKAIRAFDTTVIIVAISAKQDRKVQRLVGSCLSVVSPEHSAAIAVLNATNRFLGSSLHDH